MPANWLRILIILLILYVVYMHFVRKVPVRDKG